MQFGKLLEEARRDPTEYPMHLKPGQQLLRQL